MTLSLTCGVIVATMVLHYESEVNPSWMEVRLTKKNEHQGITAAALMEKKIAEQRFVIAGLLPSKSVGLLAGPPKSQKSFLAMSWSLSIANGTKVLGQIPVDAGEVLYLDLESHESRTRSRLAMMCKDEPAPDGLHLHFSWPRLDQGGLQRLESWFSEHPKARLLVCDVWGKVAPARTGGSLYESDYRSVEGIRQLVQKFNIAALLITHTRKAATDDPLTRIAGSNGLTGAVDAILSLARDRGQHDGKLFVSGREVSEQELQLRWDSTTGHWHLNDDPVPVMLSLSPERLAIAEFIRSSPTPVGPKLIAEGVGQPHASVRQLVRKLLRQRVITRVRGGYITNIIHNPQPEPVSGAECTQSEPSNAALVTQQPVATSAPADLAELDNVVSFADFKRASSDGQEPVH